MSNVYTTEEVAKHNHEEDLWMVYNGGVYDLTKFRTEHPGGEEILIQLAGQDGTKCFDEIGHTNEAVHLRETFKIGTVKGTFPAESPPASAGVQDTTIDDENWEYNPPQEKTSSVLPMIIAIGVAIYASLIYYLWF